MVDFQTTKHAVAFVSNVKSAISGHVFDIELVDDTLENGSLIGVGDYIKLGTYKQGEAGANFSGTIVEKSARGNWYVQIDNPDDTLFVMNAPISPYDLKQLRQESSYYISKANNEMAKGYELAKWDIVEVSDLAFDGTPQVGKTVKAANKKFQVQA